MSFMSSLWDELRLTYEDIRDTFTHKNIPNMGVRLPFRFVINNEEFVPIAFLNKEKVEGSIYFEEENAHYDISLLDIGSIHGEEAQKMQRLLSGHWGMEKLSDMLNPSFIKDFLSEYSKKSSHFEYTDSDLLFKKKVIKYCIQILNDGSIHMIMCYDMTLREGLAFQFYRPKEGVIFAQKLRLETAELLDADGDIMEEAPISVIRDMFDD